jgi:hypothetical protein
MAKKPSGSNESSTTGMPEDLSKWFTTLNIDSTLSNDQKLRMLMGQLKKQPEALVDHVSALAWFRELTTPLRQSLSAIERDEKQHSEIVTVLIEHLSALSATLLSSRPSSKEEAASFEASIIRRVFGMTEALLRQAVTPSAAAFDPDVVRRHCDRTIDLAQTLQTTLKAGKKS